MTGIDLKGELIVEQNSSEANIASANKRILFIQILWAVMGTLVFLTGITGNFIILLVLQRRSLRSIVSIFLSGLAVLNILTLLIGLPHHWLSSIFGHSMRTISYQVCLIHIWLTYVAQSSANWVLVLVTTYRFFYMKSSKRTITVMKESRARWTIVGVVAVLLVLEMILLHERGIEHNKSSYTIPGKKKTCQIALGTRAAVMRHVIVTYIPCIALFTFTLLLFLHVQLRRKESSVSRSVSDTARNMQGTLTIVLTLINVEYIITNLPLAMFMSSGHSPFEEGTLEGMEQTNIMISCLYALYYTNFTINVFLYCCSGRRFRLEMKAVLRYLFCNKDHIETLVGLESISRFDLSTLIMYKSKSRFTASNKSTPPAVEQQTNETNEEISHALWTEDTLIASRKKLFV